MKEPRILVEKVIKKVINNAIDQEKRGWPPGCAGFYYQPSRPRMSNDGRDNKRSKGTGR